MRSRLERATGVSWLVDVGADGTIFLEPNARARSLTPRELMATFGADIGFSENVAGRVIDLGEGRRSYEYRQTHHGNDVADGRVSVEVSSDGAIEAVLGRFVPGVAHAAKSPSISRASAEKIAFDDARADAPWLEEALVAKRPSADLIVDARIGEPRLVWRVALAASTDPLDPTAPSIATVYGVDARTGAIVEKTPEASFAAPVAASGKGSRGYVLGEPDIKKFRATEERAGLYTLVAQATGAVPEIRVRDASQAFGPVITSTSTGTWDERPATDPRAWGNGAAADAAHHMEIVTRYFADVVGRSSFDGKGSPIQVFVHDVYPGASGPNGWWQPRSKTFHFSDGVASSKELPATAALSTVAHELGHAYVDTTAIGGGPGGAGEPGAVGEAFADLIGVLVSHHAHPSPSEDLGHWHTGRGRYVDGVQRNLASPWASGHPSHVSELDPPEKIHQNGVIVGHAFHLMTHGAVHGGATALSGKILIPTESAIGWANLEKLVHKTIPTLRRESTFAMVAWSTIRVAKAEGIAQKPVACAWAAVGVLSTATVKTELGIDCDCVAHPGGPVMKELPCCQPLDVACCRKCDDTVLGHWQGDWGKISFQEVNGEIRGVYTYRDGTTVVKASGGRHDGCWSEEPNRSAYPGIGPAQFDVHAAEGRINGRWNHRGRAGWGENWDLTWVGPEGAIPAKHKARLRIDEDFASCR